MKKRDKVIISILAGLLVMSLYTRPLWWGVLFSPLMQELSTSAQQEEDGIYFKVGDRILRFRSLDLLMEFLRG